MVYGSIGRWTSFSACFRALPRCSSKASPARYSCCRRCHRAFTNGSVSGLCARGGFEVDNMTWTNGKLTGATILSKLGNTCRLRPKLPINVKLGTNYVNAPMVLPGLYQFSTVAGSNYTIVPAIAYETENLSATTSSGDTHQIVTNAAFSNWRGTLLTADATNDYVTYVVSNLTAGTYKFTSAPMRARTAGNSNWPAGRAAAL